jgi:hypothetical protein
MAASNEDVWKLEQRAIIVRCSIRLLHLETSDRLVV